MNPLMAKVFQRSIILFTIGILVTSIGFSSFLSPYTASAASEDPTLTLKRWLYYRGMWSCLNDGFNTNINPFSDTTRTDDQIEAGKWDPEADKKGFGYLGPGMDDADGNDGTVDCDDGSIFVQGAEAFDLTPIQLFCGINRNLSDGNVIRPNNTDCESADTFFLEEGDGGTLSEALTKALDATGKRPRYDINDNPDYKVMMYFIGKNSLEVFCGNSKPISTGSTGTTPDDNHVRVTSVASDGKRTDLVYTISVGNPERNDTDSVDDVYYNTGGNATDAKDLTCGEMAKMTRDYAADASAWIIGNPDTPLNPNVVGALTPPGGDTQSSCTVEGIGWLVCPVMNFIFMINDAAYGAVQSFLQVKPELFDTNNGIYTAWQSFRDIANVAFVIAILVIIYSQITGAGVTNYGIKRLLPRLIIAAILVNLSYVITQLAVDISNILGGSFKALFENINIGTNTPEQNWVTRGGTILATAATGVVGLVALALLIIEAPAVLLIIGMVFLLLAARQAVIAVLIVVAPLAFVAYLLPNTEQWFTKWRKLFGTLLMVFPVIAVLFGASALAAKIVQNAGADDGGISSEGMQVLALGIASIPLFGIPAVLKGAMSGLGTIGAKLNGLADKGIGSGTNKIKNGRAGEAKAAWDARRQKNKVMSRMGEGRLHRLGNSRLLKGTVPGKTLQALSLGGKFNKAIDQSSVGKVIGGDRGRAAAVAAYHKALGEEVERQQATMSSKGVQELFDIMQSTSNSRETRAAAAGMLMKRGADQHIHEVWDYLGKAQKDAGGNDTVIEDMQQIAMRDMQSAGRKTLAMGRSDMSAAAQGHYMKSFEEGLDIRMREGKIGASDIAHAGADDVARIANFLSKPENINHPGRPAIEAAIGEAMTNETLKGSLTDEHVKLFTSIIGGGDGASGGKALQNDRFKPIAEIKHDK